MPHQCTNCGHTFADGSKEMLSGCPECGGNKFQFLPPGTDAEEAAEQTDATPPDRPGEGGVSGAVGKAAATVRELVSEGAPDTEGSDADTLEDGAESVDADSTTGSPEVESITDADDSTDDLTDDLTDDSTDDLTDDSTDDLTDDSTDDLTDDPTDDPTDEPTPSSSPGSTSTPSDVRESVSDADGGGGSGLSDAEDAAQASARSEMVSSSDLPEEPPSEGRIVKEPDADADTDEPDMEALRAELNDQFESIRVLAPGQYELNLMELYDRPEYIIALQENGRYVIEVPDTFVDADRSGDVDE